MVCDASIMSFSVDSCEKVTERLSFCVHFARIALILESSGCLLMRLMIRCGGASLFRVFLLALVKDPNFPFDGKRITQEFSGDALCLMLGLGGGVGSNDQECC